MVVIIADDELKTREGLKTIIPWKDLGVDKVITAIDGAEALVISREVQPDIIISDIRMPQMTGIEFATEVKRLHPGCSIIFISGYSDKEYLKKAIQLKAVSYVEKPINPDEIIASVREAVEICKNEKLIKTVMQKNDVLRKKVAMQLIDPQISLSELSQAIRHIDINFLSAAHYCTVVFKIKKLPKNISLERIAESIEFELGAIYGTCFVSEVAINQQIDLIVHIASSTIGNKLQFNKILINVINKLNSKSDFANIYASAGKTVTKLNAIIESYRTALLASSQLFYTGYGTVAFYEELDPQNSVFSAGSEIKSKFEDTLRSGDKRETDYIIDWLYREVQQIRSSNIDDIKNTYFDLLLTLSKVSYERGIIDDKEVLSSQKNYLWKDIFEKETLSDIHDYIHKRLNDYFSSLENILKNRPVSSIIRYIEINYRNSSLMIDDIADNVHLTAKYICSIFKKETGKTVNQYITDYRVNAAKNLLKQRQVKLTEIANSVGYNDANYFTKIFKKAIGMTPSEYREKYII